MRTLARDSHGLCEPPRQRKREHIQRIVERMHQFNAFLADVAHQLPSALYRGPRLIRMHRKLNHRNAGCPKFLTAQARRQEASHSRLELRPIQKPRRFGHLALAPAEVQLAGHQ